MNILQKLLFCVTIFTVLIAYSQAVCPTQCLHLGTLNEASCSCECYPAWEGTYCEKAKGNCATDQPSDCGTNLPSSFCIFDSINIYCPQMCSNPACTCGYDECLNGGVFDPITCQCDCPFGIYGKVCENLSQCAVIYECENLGTFNPTTCACDCISSNYGGNRCETLTCNLPDPTYCDSNPSSSCVAGNYIYATCPQKCGRCIVTTMSTTTIATTTVPTSTQSTTTVIDIIVTQPTLSEGSTASTVSTGTTGTIASTATTVSTGTTGTTGTTATAAPTTSVVTSCQPLTCQNGFIFNTNTCSCPCSTGFSGTLCETYDCTLTPTIDSQLNGLCDTVLTCDSAASQCPFKCLCGGTTGAPTTSGPSTSTAAPTTSVVTSCQPLTCQNGFVFNTNTCSCPCGTGFSGNLCQNYDCTLSPTVDSQLNGLCDTVLTCDSAASQCPFKCLCGGTTMA